VDGQVRGGLCERSRKQHPGPRSTPAVGEGKVCTLGVGGIVSCLDAASGKVVWRTDKKTATKPFFYTSSSPMIVDGKCIVYVRGADRLRSGQRRGEMDMEGQRHPVRVTGPADGRRHQTGRDADPGRAGGQSALPTAKMLWEIRSAPAAKTTKSNFGTPVIDGQTVIYSANPKGKGAAHSGRQDREKGDGFSATELWQKEPGRPPVSHAGAARRPAVRRLHRPEFLLHGRPHRRLALDDKDTQVGKCGAILDAGPVLLALSSDKDLIVLRPSKKAYEELARYRVADAENVGRADRHGNHIYVKDKGGSLTLWTIQ